MYANVSVSMNTELVFVFVFVVSSLCFCVLPSPACVPSFDACSEASRLNHVFQKNASNFLISGIECLSPLGNITETQSQSAYCSLRQGSGLGFD